MLNHVQLRYFAGASDAYLVELKGSSYKLRYKLPSNCHDHQVFIAFRSVHSTCKNLRLFFLNFASFDTGGIFLFGRVLSGWQSS